MYQEAKIAEIREQLQQLEKKVLDNTATDTEFEKYLELMEEDVLYFTDFGKKLLMFDETVEKLDKSLDDLRNEVARTEKRVNAFGVITKELPKLMKK